MRLHITGKNLDIGDALRSHIGNKLTQLSERYFDGTVTAHVTVEKLRQRFATDCTLHLVTGLVLQAHGFAADAHGSVDEASDHLEKRLRRYKQRLKSHHKTRREPVRQEQAASYVFAAAEDAEEEPHGLDPVVIAESQASVPELSVGEAVMQLDLSSAPFVFFRNTRDGGLNVVYRRGDGNIGWIEPGLRKSA